MKFQLFQDYKIQCFTGIINTPISERGEKKVIANTKLCVGNTIWAENTHMKDVEKRKKSKTGNSFSGNVKFCCLFFFFPAENGKSASPNDSIPDLMQHMAESHLFLILHVIFFLAQYKPKVAYLNSDKNSPGTVEYTSYTANSPKGLGGTDR